MTAGRPLWFVDHAPVFGGGQVMLVKLGVHAQRRGLQVTVLCPEGTTLATTAHAAGLRVVPVAMPHFGDPSVIGLPLALLALARALRAAPPDAVVVPTTPWASALCLTISKAWRGRPVVHLLVEQDTAGRPSARAVLRRRGVPLTVGANAGATYRRALERSDVFVLNTPLSAGELAAGRSAPARTRGAHAGGPATLGVVARLIPEKGLIELVRELAAADPDDWGRLRIAGEDQDAAYVRRLRDEIDRGGLGDRVELLGYVADVTEFLDGLDVLVVPSTGNEGQPTVIVEALARGLGVVVREPVMSLDFAGLPVRAYRDAQGLARALRGRDPPAPLEAVAERFGPDQALDALLAAAASPRAVISPRR